MEPSAYPFSRFASYFICLLFYRLLEFPGIRPLHIDFDFVSLVPLSASLPHSFSSIALLLFVDFLPGFISLQSACSSFRSFDLHPRLSDKLHRTTREIKGEMGKESPWVNKKHRTENDYRAGDVVVLDQVLASLSQPVEKQISEVASLEECTPLPSPFLLPLIYTL